MDTPPQPPSRGGRAAWVRRTAYRRALLLALVGAVGLATPALAAGDLDDIRDRIDRVEQQQGRASTDKRASESRAGELDAELEHTSTELVAADERLRRTTAQVEQARINLQEAELDLADAEAEAERIETELALARANETQVEEALAANVEEQDRSRDTVGAIARESYKQGGVGSLAATLDLLSGEDDAVDRMAMARTVLRVQDQQIRTLATQEAQQVVEQDRLAGVREDIAYLLARAEANVIAKDQARAAADAATVELEELEAQQARDKEALEEEKAKVAEALAAERARTVELEDQLAELARTKHGLQAEEQAELRRIAEEEARRQAEEEARRKAAEEAARQAAAEEAARQRAAEREAQRQRDAAAEAQRRADAEAAAEAQRRADAADREARAAQEAGEEARRREAEQARRQPAPAPSPPVSSGALLTPTGGSVTSEFGMRLHPVLGIHVLHGGRDWGAGCGTPVHAAEAGTVYTVSYDDSRGNYVVIDHGVHKGVNLTTTYMHFQGQATVGIGQGVSRGQLIGYVGTTGSSTGCHLHFETRENGTAVDPRRWL